MIKTLKANSLFKKTYYIITSSLMIIIGVFLYILMQNQKDTLNKLLFSKAHTIANTIVLSNSELMIKDDYSLVIENLQNIIQNNNEIKYIIIYNESYEPILNKKMYWEILESIPKNIIDMNLDYSNGQIINTMIDGEENYHFSYPIKFSGVDWGWINIGLGLKSYKKEINTLMTNSLILVFIMLILALIFSYLLTKKLIGPIINLHSATKQVKSGDFEINISNKGKDEISDLTNSFIEMVNEVKISNNKLKIINEKLEDRVKVRTNELNLLNKELDNKVKEEVQRRRKNEQILIQQSRFAAMGEMIGNIAHQWRQPLNALGLLLQNIQVAYELDHIDQDYIDKIINKGNTLTLSMSNTIDDFRNFFKIDKKREEFIISEVLYSSLDILQSSLKNNNIELIIDVDKTLKLNNYSRELSQAFLNILSNAKDALLSKENKRKIYISIYNKESDIIISFLDNGGGINEKIINRIFDPYFTTKEEGKGTGIGLYMTKTIIENHMKGHFKASNYKNGALFEIYFKKEN